MKTYRSDRHGCYNRTLVHGYWANSGYDEQDGMMGRVYVVNRMSTYCNYERDLDYSDPKCEGCKHAVAVVEG